MRTPAAQFSRRIAFVPQVTVTDDLGTETVGDGTPIKAFAKVLFGSGRERRELAQETSSQTATFRVRRRVKLRAVDATWEIDFDGARWGIEAPPAQAGLQGEELEFTATRKGA